MAWSHLGWECVGVSEIEPFPCAVLEHYYPDVPNLGDICKITNQQIADLGQIDLIVAGFPCQDVSIAGKRKGFKDENDNRTRSGLFHEAMRIIECAKQHCGLRYALLENVPGLLSSHGGADFATVVEELVGCDTRPPRKWKKEGCAVGPSGMLEWSLLDARWFGLAQRRKRIFALADFGHWQRRPPILLESYRLRGDSPKGRKAREDLAPTISARTNGGGGLGTDFDLDGGLIAAIQERAICENPNAGPDGIGVRTDGLAYTLEARSTVQAVAFGGNNTSGPIETATALNACSSSSGRMDFERETFVTFDTTQVTSPANRNNPKSGDPCHPLAATAHAPAIAFTQNSRSELREMEVSGALSADPGMNQTTYLRSRSGVRRLTPTECERLQGFPDDYTLIPFRKRMATDSPRYKALGNSMAVPCMRWIGHQITKSIFYGR